LILISTGYAMAGALYDLYRKHYGKNGAPVLIWQSDTRTMNPNISQEFIDAQIELDPRLGAVNGADYSEKFRTSFA
jgi:hypothetical protein